DDNPFNDIDYNPISNNRVAVIIETRKLDYLNWVASTVKYHLNWPIIFYCSHNSKNMIEGVNKNIIPNDIDYNNILKDKSFWNDIDEEHILIFQHDSFVLRGDNIEDFTKYDYIGSPWYWTYGNYTDRRYKN